MSAHEHLEVPSRCVIRELRDGDVEAFVELRREALFDSPLAFAASPSDDLFSSPGTVREQLRACDPSPLSSVHFGRILSVQWVSTVTAS